MQTAIIELLDACNIFPPLFSLFLAFINKQFTTDRVIQSPQIPLLLNWNRVANYCWECEVTGFKHGWTREWLLIFKFAPILFPYSAAGTNKGRCEMSLIAYLDLTPAFSAHRLWANWSKQNFVQERWKRCIGKVIFSCLFKKSRRTVLQKPSSLREGEGSSGSACP